MPTPPPIAHLDFETYSAVPGGIKYAGAESYCEHPSMMIRCAAYDLNDGRGVRAWASEPVGDLFAQYPTAPPEDLFEHVQRGGSVSAWNSRFEELVWPHWPAGYGAPAMHPDQWIDTMAMGQAYGLPGSLALSAKAMRAPAKLAGTALIELFCNPPFVPFAAHMAKAKKFIEYNIADVVAEKALFWRLPRLSAYERRVWQVNARINARGVAVDMQAAQHLQAVVDGTKRKLNLELSRITGGQLTTSDEIQAMQKWLAANGVNMGGMRAEDISATLKRTHMPADIRRVLEIRQALGKKSVEKLNAILASGASTGRLRGLMQYCGAEATGRWAGRGPQPQNLPGRGGSLDARELLARSAEEIVSSETDPLTIVSRSLRSLFVPAPGMEFVDVDYSAIEAVVIAEIAQEEWRREVFRTHGKIYEASAAKISGVSLEEILDYKIRTGEHHPLRSKLGKFAELASSYGGARGAWIRFGADKYLSHKEIDDGVTAWRVASPAIVAFWGRVEAAAKAAITTPGQRFPVAKGISYYGTPDGGPLVCTLQSGRNLYYHYPRIEPGFHPLSGKPIQQITFESRDVQGRWLRGKTYGGSLTENIVQATARDILAHALLVLAAFGYRIVLHVHDEVLIEVPIGSTTVPEIAELMLALPSWAREYPLRADGWIGNYYRKD